MPNICSRKSCPKPQSECAEINGEAVCFCNYNGYDGKYPNCIPISGNHLSSQFQNYVAPSPKCWMNSDCLPQEFCHKQTNECEKICKQPWHTEFCGSNSICEARKHVPICRCKPGFTKNNSSFGCIALEERAPQCPTGYTMNPRTKECTSQIDRNIHRCTENNQCGQYAACRPNPRTNQKQCICRRGFFGDPTKYCEPRNPSEIKVSRKDYQSCRACGPNSVCKVIKDRIHCHCNDQSVGIPPTCQRRAILAQDNSRNHSSAITAGMKFCRKNSDCRPNEACDENNTCINLCSVCARNSLCVLLRAHEKVRCDCEVGYFGKRCLVDNPCSLDMPCGPNSACRVHRDNSVECVCHDGFNGNPYSFSGCKKIAQNHRASDMCSKLNSPCGPNSVCFSVNGWPHCTCDGYSTGQPPNCQIMSDPTHA